MVEPGPLRDRISTPFIPRLGCSLSFSWICTSCRQSLHILSYDELQKMYLPQGLTHSSFTTPLYCPRNSHRVLEVSYPSWRYKNKD